MCHCLMQNYKVKIRKTIESRKNTASPAVPVWPFPNSTPSSLLSVDVTAILTFNLIISLFYFVVLPIVYRSLNSVV